jgi:hypothetical protein
LFFFYLINFFPTGFCLFILSGIFVVVKDETLETASNNIPQLTAENSTAAGYWIAGKSAYGLTPIKKQFPMYSTNVLILHRLIGFPAGTLD